MGKHLNSYELIYTNSYELFVLLFVVSHYQRWDVHVTTRKSVDVLVIPQIQEILVVSEYSHERHNVDIENPRIIIQLMIREKPVDVLVMTCGPHLISRSDLKFKIYSWFQSIHISFDISIGP